MPSKSEYLGDPVKRANKVAKYKRMTEHYMKHGQVAERTAKYFGTDRRTVLRAVDFCEGK